MLAPLLGLLVLQTPVTLDSAEVARVLVQLKASDSTVCELAGQSLTNYGGFWNRSRSDIPMPRPMPTPMPMPGGGGGGPAHVMHDVMRAHRFEGRDAAVLGAFRAVIRDDNRCVRNIAARVLGNAGDAGAYDLFAGLLRDSRPGLRETGALGLGELEDVRAINPLADALDDAELAVRRTAAWALGEIEAAQQDAVSSVRRAATWALRQIDDEDHPRVRVRPRVRIKS